MWSWIFHRITGVGVLVFLFIHIIDTMLVHWGPAVYNRVIAIYRLPVFRVGEVVLVAAVLFHALNGIRIILIDFWPVTTRYHRQMFYIAMALFVIAMIPATYVMLRPLWGA